MRTKMFFFFILMCEKRSLGTKLALNASDVKNGVIAVVLVAEEA